MNCNEFTERLSDFVDGELPQELKSDFAAHLDLCAACSAKLQELRLLSQVMRLGSVDKQCNPLQFDHQHQANAGVPEAVAGDMPVDVLVDRMWSAIALRLDASESTSGQAVGSLPALNPPLPEASTSVPSTSIPAAAVESPLQKESPSFESRPLDRRWRSGAVAALLAIACTGLWFLPGIMSTWRNNSMNPYGSANSASISPVNAVIDFQELLTTQIQPRQALVALSQQFRGKETPPADARTLLGYEPSMARELPDGLQLVALQVLKLPHCKCPAGKCTCGPGGCNCSVSLCQRVDGSDLLVIEHCESQPISFGDIPSELVHRAEQEFRFLKAGEQYAATWTANQRRLTAIGLNDLEEAALLIADAK